MKRLTRCLERKSDENDQRIPWPDLKVEGDVESKESIRIDGEYKGNINSQREVTIGPSGDVEGEIHAPIIRVSGSVKGSLHASRLLELLGEARVQGDLNTRLEG